MGNRESKEPSPSQRRHHHHHTRPTTTRPTTTRRTRTRITTTITTTRRRPPRDLGNYQEYLKLGEVLVAYARVLLIGPGGVGKSSLLRGLMNECLPELADSTQFAETLTLKPCSQLWTKQSEGEDDSHWVAVTPEDQIKELVGLVLSVAHSQSKGKKASRAARLLQSLMSAVATKAFHSRLPQPHPMENASDCIQENIESSVIQDVLSQVQHLAQSNPDIQAPESEVLLNVWDCGGQPVYLDLMSSFLTSRGMFLLLYDASRDLLEKYVALCHRKGKVVAEQHSYLTTLDLLLQWMSMIHATLSRNRSSKMIAGYGVLPDEDKSHEPSAEKGKKSELPKNGSGIPDFPRIIPVGTHGDKPEVKMRKAEIIRELEAQCESRAFAYLLKAGVIVDNTTAGQSENEDPGFKYIRKMIFRLASKSLAIPTPVAWVLFRKVFQKMAEVSPVVSYQQALAVGKACGIPADVLQSALNFYHELAVFFHFTRIPSLHPFVFADPQWLVKQLAALLSLEGFETVGNPMLWNPLRQKGILVQSLYEEVWKNGKVPPQSLMDLLEHFLLVAPINTHSKIHCNPGKEYFVPSVLPYHCSAESSQEHPKEALSAAPLHLTFSTKYVPPGFFTRLATALTKEHNLEVAFNHGVYRNRITLHFGKIDEITITEQTVSIVIAVTRCEPRRAHNPFFSSVCSKILKLIQACSADVREWLPGITEGISFLCDGCCKDGIADHFIEVPEGATTCPELRCQKGKRYVPTTAQQLWMRLSPEEQVFVDLSSIEASENEAVARAVTAEGKLEQLAKQLEMTSHLSSLSQDKDKALVMIRRWEAEVKRMNIHTRAHLVHHLRCSGMPSLADKVQYGEFLSEVGQKPLQDQSSNLQANQDPLNDMDFVKCSRLIEQDLSGLAAIMDINDEEMATIQSQYKKPQSQALQMLKKWHSQTQGTRQKLVEILKSCGSHDAAKLLLQGEAPALKDLETELQEVTQWYRLGLQLDMHDHTLQEIQLDELYTAGRRRRMLQKWLELCERPTWEAIAAALEGIQCSRLARRLREKYCN